MDFTVLALAYFIVFGAIGVLIGRRRGRPVAGLFWAMLLGPIGWLLMFLLPSASASATAGKSTPCPHCGGALPLLQPQCNHCGNKVSWLRGRAFKPSRAA